MPCRATPAASRSEIQQLVAMNQLDLIERMMKSDSDRAFLKDIIEQGKNLRGRFNFEAGDLTLPLPSSTDVITREGG
jgi:hypothetical protein